MTQIYLLGAGTPTPTRDRFGSSQVVRVGDDLVMFDCGPATTYKLVRAGLWPTSIDHVFFTHHHFDHDVDYPCFLLCRWDQGAGKEEPLTVRGPRPTEQITHRILDAEQGAFSHDWIARINAPLSQHVYVSRGGLLLRQPPSVDAQDIQPGVVYSGKDWQVTAAPAEHVQPWLDSLAYRIDTPDGSIVITGDTRPCRSVVDLARGANMLVCMCLDDQASMDDDYAEEAGRTGAAGAACMARETDAKTLVLTHMGPHITSPGRLEAVWPTCGGSTLAAWCAPRSCWRSISKEDTDPKRAGSIQCAVQWSRKRPRADARRGWLARALQSGASNSLGALGSFKHRPIVGWVHPGLRRVAGPVSLRTGCVPTPICASRYEQPCAEECVRVAAHVAAVDLL